MRYLIDGYNLMYAGGLLGKRLGPDGFRQTRTRFLNDLADALGPFDAGQTVVVFDSSNAPGDVPRKASHKGISVLYAVDNENADERIEELIAAHPTPRTLNVVSSDRRIRQAASRRKSRGLTADEFWVELDARKRRRAVEPAAPRPAPARPAAPAVSAEESAYWLREFADLDQSEVAREALGGGNPMLTDAEIAEIEREVEREGG